MIILPRNEVRDGSLNSKTLYAQGNGQQKIIINSIYTHRATSTEYTRRRAKTFSSLAFGHVVFLNDNGGIRQFLASRLRSAMVYPPIAVGSTFKAVPQL